MDVLRDFLAVLVPVLVAVIGFLSAVNARKGQDKQTSAELTVELIDKWRIIAERAEAQLAETEKNLGDMRSTLAEAHKMLREARDNLDKLKEREVLWAKHVTDQNYKIIELSGEPLRLPAPLETIIKEILP